MTSDFRFSQPSNACHPISFTLSGIVTDVSPVQSTNAKRPILFTPRGMAIDVNSTYTSFKDTPEGIWLKNNCHLYGFIIRYPEGKEHITGYGYEPWHIRYIDDTDAAKEIMDDEYYEYKDGQNILTLTKKL